MFALGLSTVFLAVGALCQNSVGPVVDTPLGRVEGWERQSRDGRWYQAFTGIPYAQPPVGKLRFRAPQPPERWNGTLMATGDLPMCIQKMPDPKGSEDCLYLNVYRPKNGLSKMPVLFRVHGGAFQVGNLGTRENADYLMDEDVVLVQIHYRLNGFGFMGLNDKMMPGNFGMKDQIMALKWVKYNIAYFGGDPKSVTVFGESAGGASSHILLNSPAAEGLVHRAVSDSGTANNIWSEAKPEIVRKGTLAVAQKVGCRITDSNQEIFNCLQKVSSKDLINAMPAGFDGVVSFAPSYEPLGTEDPVIPQDLSLIPSKKPWITSNCNGEFILALGSLKPEDRDMALKDLDGYLQKRITKYSAAPNPAKVREGAAIVKNAYFRVKEPEQDLITDICKLDANITFFYPALHDLRTHQGPKWYFFLEYVGEISQQQTQSYGLKFNVAAHAQQQLYYFNCRGQFPGLSPKETPDDCKVSKRMIKYLVNFAYYNDPTPAGTPFKWDQFTGHQILRIANSDDDFMGDQLFYQPLLNVLNIWSYIIGWGSPSS